MKIQEGKDTAEFKAFVACTEKLVSTIKGDLSIADKLLEKGLISVDTYDEVSSHSLISKVKARKIFSGVRDKIEVDKANFNTFCNILADSESRYYTDLYQKLKGEEVNAVLCVPGATNEYFKLLILEKQDLMRLGASDFISAWQLHATTQQ